MSAVACGKLGVSIRRSVRIKYPNIKECSLKTDSPRNQLLILPKHPVLIASLVTCPKGTVESIASSLAHLFNMSIKFGKVPTA